jgi:hypothetical protein
VEYLAMVSTREQLHQLVDRIPDSELVAAKRALERLTYRSTLAEFLDSAELDDEPNSPEEKAAIAEAWDDVAAGHLVSDEDLRHELGLDEAS